MNSKNAKRTTPEHPVATQTNHIAGTENLYMSDDGNELIIANDDYSIG